MEREEGKSLVLEVGRPKRSVDQANSSRTFRAASGGSREGGRGRGLWKGRCSTALTGAKEKGQLNSRRKRQRMNTKIWGRRLDELESAEVVFKEEGEKEHSWG